MYIKRSEHVSSDTRMVVSEVLPNDFKCCEGPCGEINNLGNRRFAAIFTKICKSRVSSKAARDRKGLVEFAVTAFMRLPISGRFLRSLDGHLYVVLTQKQSVEWVYNSYISKAALNRNAKDETDVDNKVALILRNQKSILAKMQTEGKINHNLSHMLPGP
mmetsp:Transcript_18884/g.27932  ORF Transcript_18884/g.27932 Transcript_18884/m.27932 type:complete len:160 (+) Transcript_18884:109-588(+)